jgi:hypothetical protein
MYACISPTDRAVVELLKRPVGHLTAPTKTKPLSATERFPSERGSHPASTMRGTGGRGEGPGLVQRFPCTCVQPHGYSLYFTILAVRKLAHD